MTAQHCPREWEAEAERDGRLSEAARVAYELHQRGCVPCAAERARIERLSSRLRMELPDAQDDLVLRQVRRRVIEAVEQQALVAARSGGKPSYLPRTLWTTSLGMLLIAIGLFVRSSHQRHEVAEASSRPSALRFQSTPGTLFEHEHRQTLDYVTLHRGDLSLDFDRGSQGALSVRVPDGEIRDLGTVFRVVVADGHTQEIDVQLGAVVFTRNGAKDVIVSAGEVYRRDANEDVAAAEAQPIDAGHGSQVVSAGRVSDAGAPLHASRLATREHSTKAAGSTLPNTDAQQDLAYLHILALIEAGRTLDARAAALAYMREFPAGFRRPEVARIAQPAQ